MAKKKIKHTPHKKNDSHHLLWQRRKWSWEMPYRALRTHPCCIVKMPAETLHKMIHAEVREVPLPSKSNADYALWHLNYLKDCGVLKKSDSIEKHLRVLIALFDCVEQPTADALKKQLEIVRKFYNEPP